MEDLLRFSYQVAQGLDFLAAKNVSHINTKFHNKGLRNKACNKYTSQFEIMFDENSAYYS
jgi:hypothetical protein